jgi:hypothetical protein
MRSFLLVGILAQVAIAAGANLADIKSVYVLPMSNGADQYLANRLLAGQVVTVTTDPQAADAVFTDAIGPAFEKRLAELYPPPPPPEPEKKEDEDESKTKDIIGKDEPVIRISSFRKGRGVVFLVDRRTKQVVWSTHERPKNSTPQELDRMARRVSDQLKKDYGAK